MAEKNNITLVQEEELCEFVHNFPILYDKSHKGYKERDAVANAWEEISNSLEFTSSGM